MSAFDRYARAQENHRARVVASGAEQSFEAIETEVRRNAAFANPAVRVVLDSQSAAVIVRMSLGGYERVMHVHYGQTLFSVAQCSHQLALSLCESVGRAWRPEGWKGP